MFLIGQSFALPQQSDEVCRVANGKLLSFVRELLETYFALVEKRLMLDKRSRDNALVVRALDRFFRRYSNLVHLYRIALFICLFAKNANSAICN